MEAGSCLADQAIPLHGPQLWRHSLQIGKWQVKWSGGNGCLARDRTGYKHCAERRVALDKATAGGLQGCQIQLAAKRYEYGQMMVAARQSLFRLRIPPKEFLGFGKGSGVLGCQ
jgi:hypothetical protein